VFALATILERDTDQPLTSSRVTMLMSAPPPSGTATCAASEIAAPMMMAERCGGFFSCARARGVE